MKFLNIKESDMENRDPESYWKLVLFKIFSLMGLLFFTLQTIGTPVESMSQHIIRATIASLLISVFLFVRKDSHLKYGALLFFTPIALVSIAIPFLHVYGMNSPILNNYVSIILASYLLLGRKFGIIFYLGLTLPLLMHYFDVFRFFGIGQHLAYTPEIKASLIARTVVHTSVLMVMATVEKIHLELRNDISSRSIKEQKKESELVLTRVASGF